MSEALTDIEARGAPGTRVLFEDEHTRVWLLELAAGESTEWHTHPWDYVFVVDRPGLVRLEYEDGVYEDQDDFLGQVVHRRRGHAHRLVNLSGGPYRNVVIEFLSQAPPDKWEYLPPRYSYGNVADQAEGES
ncbi:cupin domain-containing protein [Actinosynnema sp. CS-041913]|uniref:cupin domain-containing protein n=1 Tax=Actinosynnema sp. CS-041913 TaxID=3239917 RepID=UPI003D8E29E7